MKRYDAWYTVEVVDRLAVPAVERLAGVSSVTPDGLTLVALALRMLAVLAVWMGHVDIAVCGWMAGFVFDCMDGKLARARNQSSAFGRALDRWSDLVARWCFYGSVGLTLLAGLSLWATFAWLVTWTIAWAREDGQALRDDVAGFTAQSALLTRYLSWTGARRLQPWPVSGVEESQVILPLAILAGVPAPAMIAVASYRILLTLGRLMLAHSRQ